MTHIPTGKQFKISTISELASVATESNIDLLLADLKLAILSGIYVGDIHQRILPEAGQFNKLKFFTWIDDGKTSLEAISFVDENDKEQFRIDKNSFKNKL